ncbi:PAS domain S-box protein [bacterium]|nr:PAS domain S-box protein [bacterium]
MLNRKVVCFMFIVASSLAPYRSQCIGQQMLPSIDLSKVDATTLSHRLETVKSLPCGDDNEYFSVDLDGDGIDEMIKISNHSSVPSDPNYIQVLSGQYDLVRFRANFYGRLQLSKFFCDLDGDGKKEIFVSVFKSDSTWLHVLNLEGEELISILGAVKPEGINRKWNCNIYVYAIMDVNSDGHLDVILTVDTDYAYQPRGVYSLDVYNKKFIWKYKTGFSPGYLHLFDIDGDKRREILLGSSAPDNGEGTLGKNFIVNGTDDKHTYLTVLDSMGNCLRSQIISNEYAGVAVYPHDLDGDNKQEVFVTFSSHRDPPEPLFFAIWNPQTGGLTKVSLEKQIAGDAETMPFLDANRDGRDDFFICFKDGSIEIRDSSLDIVRTRQFPDLLIYKALVAELNNDGEEEIVLSGQFRGQYVTLILNRKLELLSFLDNGPSPFFCGSVVNPGFGRDKLLLTSGSGYAYLMKMKQQYPFLKALSWGAIGYGFLCGAVLTGVFLILFFTTRNRQSMTKTLESIFQSVQVGLILLDSEGRVKAMNRGMEPFINNGRESMIGISYEKLFSDSSYTEIQQIITSSFEDELGAIEKETTVFCEGAPWNLLIGVDLFPINKNGKTGRLVTIRNITGMVHSKRAVAWATMAQRLAHEIKTPLSTVMLTAQRLQMEFDENPEKESRGTKYTARIIRQVNRLQKMTDAFLKFAHIESSRRESIEIKHLLIRCLDEYKFQFGSGVRVEKSIEADLPHLTGDSQQLQIVLQNLINNGLTAMEGKGALTIRAHLVQWLHGTNRSNHQQAIQLEIADTGRGISKDDRDKLFEPFFSKSETGTGMGLVIVKKIIEDHHGEIKIASELGVGTTVFLTLPVFDESEDSP